MNNATFSDLNLVHLYALLVRVKAPISSCCMCMARMCASGSVGCLLPLSPSIRHKLSLFKNTCNKDTKQISPDCHRKLAWSRSYCFSKHTVYYYAIDQNSKLSLTWTALISSRTSDIFADSCFQACKCQIVPNINIV